MQLRDTPLVSIGLPIYNGERFLAACIDSVLAQTYRNFEIIISDNASTDGTVAICREYARRDSRVRVVQHDRNRGSAWNHNHVRELARGAYFKWYGADDLMAPGFLGAAVSALEARPEAVLAYACSIVIDDENRELERTSWRMPLDVADVKTRFGALLSALEFTQNVHYGVIRASSLARARPLGSFLANDRCMIAELALMGPFVEVDEFLMYRRRHEGHRKRTRLDEQRLYIPEDARPFRPREWIVLRENLKSVARAHLGAGTKLRLVGALASWAFHQRVTLVDEWKQVTAQAAKRRASSVLARQ